MHLFFSCNFSIRIWNYLQVDWFQGSNMQKCISKARRDFGHPFFLEVVFTAAWNIWILRNCQTFRAERASFGAWKCKFVHDISLLAHRVRTRLGQSYWLGSRTFPDFGRYRQVPLLAFSPFVVVFRSLYSFCLASGFNKDCGALPCSKQSKKKKKTQLSRKRQSARISSCSTYMSKFCIDTYQAIWFGKDTVSVVWQDCMHWWFAWCTRHVG